MYVDWLPASLCQAFEKAHKLAPLGKSSLPEDIVNAVKYLLNANAVTGSTLIVDGGQHLWPTKRDVQFEVKEKNN